MSACFRRRTSAPLIAWVLTLQPCACRAAHEPQRQPVQEASQAQAHAQHATLAEPSAGTAPGACTKTDRTGYVHDPNAKFITQVRDCSKETWAERDKNITCLTKALPALSHSCAGCFADMASCSLANCKMACMLSSTSDGCNQCANTKCQPSLVTCTGVARAALP